MGIKRYVAKADTTITNAFELDLSTRGTGSNMGASDVTEVFSIFAQQSTSSLETARALYNFPVDSTVKTDRTNKVIPASGSVSFYLKLYNARHAHTLPKDYYMTVAAVSRSWGEGTGLDMEGYTDLTYDEGGANWIRSTGSTSWTSEGGDIYTDASSSYEVYFDTGTEDIELDITTLVEQWINSAGNVLGSKDNNGLIVKLTSVCEDKDRSYYTKKFFARGTEFFFKRPVIEARWNSSKKDNRGNFYLSSSLASAANNLNRLYLYNYIKGQLQDIPGLGSSQSTSTEIYLSVYPSLGGEQKNLPVGGGVATDSDKIITGSWVETGIYSASFAYTGSETTLYDVWSTSKTWSASTEIYTGSAFTVENFNTPGTLNTNPNNSYVNSITNMRSKYSTDETARFRLYTRNKNWNPNIYTKATTNIQTHIVEDAYYKVIRVSDNVKAVGYGTGSLHHTRLSYDNSGSYFDLDMSLLAPNYTYGIRFIFYQNGKYTEQPETFKFRVE